MEAGAHSGSFTDEDYARSVIHPRADPEGVLSPLAMFDFGKLDPKKPRTPYIGSIAWKALLKTESATHAYGCRLAERGNRKRREKKAPAHLDKWTEGLFYVGYFDLNKDDLVGAKSDYYNISIVHSPEDGEDAHCNITLTCREDLADNIEDFKGKSSADRTAIINFFFSKKSGAKPHVCAEDAEETRMLELHARIFPATPT